MDAAFKRLWARTKNKKNDAARPPNRPSNDGLRAQSRPSFSTVGDGRPSMALSSRPRQSQDMLGAREFSSTSSDYNRRIQPVLVGISTSDNNNNTRPVTAGGAQKGLQPKTEAGMRSLDLSRAQTSASGKYSKGSLPGYIDIFAVAHTLPMQSSQYNEEIAERNSESVRFAAQGERSKYVPTSRYQEEVANRNLLASSRSSTEASRRSTDHDRSQSSISNKSRDMSVVNANGYYIHQQSPGRPSPTSRDVQDGAAYHSFQYGSRSREGGSQLAAIPQEDVGDDLKHGHGQIPQSMRNGEKLPAKKVVYETLRSGHNVQQEADHQGRDQQPTLNSNNNVHGLGVSGYSSRPATALYEGSDSNIVQEGTVKHQAGLSGFHLQPAPRQSSVRTKHMDTSGRSPSINSYNSQPRKNSGPNRTIMDLTGDDDTVSDGSSIYGYSQYSPVVEQAKVGSFAKPAQTEAATKGRTLSTISDFELRRNSHQSVQTKPIIEERHQSQATSSDPEIPPRSPARITFSPINTVASLNPESNVPSAQKGERLTMVQRVAAALEARSANELPTPPTSTTTNIVVDKAVREINHRQTEVDNNTDLTPKASIINKAHIAEITPDASVSPSITPTKSIPSTMHTSTISQLTPKTVTDVKRKASSIYDSPQSLASVDYVHPGDAFGVRTRDFAVSPRKSTASLKKADSQALQRSATENATRAASQSTGKLTPVAPSKTPTRSTKSRVRQKSSASQKYSSEFDEVGFARKQAEARAALIRLQQSLAEDFLTLPEPVKRRNNPDSDTDQKRVDRSVTVSPSEKAAPAITASKPPSSFRGSSHDYENRTLSMTGARSRSGGNSTRKTAPPSLKHVEAASTPVPASALSPRLLEAMQASSKPPLSPGEISLSSFPIPASRPTSEHEPGSVGNVGPHILIHMRRDSGKSHASITSQYSIPRHMIPDRSSSYRDLMLDD